MGDELHQIHDLASGGCGNKHREPFEGHDCHPRLDHYHLRQRVLKVVNTGGSGPRLRALFPVPLFPVRGVCRLHRAHRGLLDLLLDLQSRQHRHPQVRCRQLVQRCDPRLLNEALRCRLRTRLHDDKYRPRLHRRLLLVYLLLADLNGTVTAHVRIMRGPPEASDRLRAQNACCQRRHPQEVPEDEGRR